MGAGPLESLQIIELGGIGPVPFAAMMLADLGANVVRLVSPAESNKPENPVLYRGRVAQPVDLKDQAGLARVRELAAQADILLEGFRPGVLERLGLGPDVLATINPRLVVGRMTGFGQTGPLSQEAGHDLNYIALSGALASIGPSHQPTPPLNLVGDFGGGGMMLAFGVLAGVCHARSSGVGQVIDASMVDGSALLMSMTYGLLAQGRWVDQREANLLDGAAPFYRTYRCADGRHVAVGAIEPQFYAALLKGLGLSDHPLLADQHDRGNWAEMAVVIGSRFMMESRDTWGERFVGTDGCVTPVLSMTEAPGHPYNVARRTFIDIDGVTQPAPAPRFHAPRLGGPNDHVG